MYALDSNKWNFSTYLSDWGVSRWSLNRCFRKTKIIARLWILKNILMPGDNFPNSQYFYKINKLLKFKEFRPYIKVNRLSPTEKVKWSLESGVNSNRKRRENCKPTSRNGFPITLFKKMKIMYTTLHKGCCISHVNQISVFFTFLFINAYYFQAGKWTLFCSCAWQMDLSCH